MITTITGDNDFEMQRKLHHITADFIKNYSDLAVEQLDINDNTVAEVFNAIDSLPFLSDRKLLLLNKFSNSKEFIEKFEQILDSNPESVDIVLIEPKLDKRLSFYKKLVKQTEFINLVSLNERELPNWIIQTVNKSNGTIDISTANYLARTVGSNQLMLASEIDKLLLYENKITKEGIDLLCEKTLQSSIFDLIEAAFSNNLKNLISLYSEQRNQNVEPPQIIALLNWQLNIFLLINLAKENNFTQLISQAKISPYAIQKSRRVADSLSISKLKNLIHDLLDIDIAIKTSAVDSDELLQNYLISIAY